MSFLSFFFVQLPTFNGGASAFEKVFLVQAAFLIADLVFAICSRRLWCKNGSQAGWRDGVPHFAVNGQARSRTYRCNCVDFTAKLANHTTDVYNASSALLVQDRPYSTLSRNIQIVEASPDASLHVFVTICYMTQNGRARFH